MFLSDKMILDIQNISAIIIGIYSIYIYVCCLYGYKNQAMIHMEYLSYIVVKHAFLDFIVNKSYDIKLHHCFIFGFILYYKYYNLTQEDAFIFSITVSNTEISTIFYVFKYWLPENSTIYNINMIIFYLSFLKFRIYDFYSIIEDNREFNIVFKKFEYGYLSKISQLSIYGLYILNIYWFTIMTKVMIKQLLKPYFTNEINDTLCFFLRLIKSTMHLFSFSIKKDIYLLDIISISSLSLTSYNFNSSEITEFITNNENPKLNIKECVFLHLNSFIGILINMRYTLKNNYILLSCGLHTYSMIVCIVLSMDMCSNYTKLYHYQ